MDLDGAGYTVVAFERAQGEIGHKRHWGPILFRTWGEVMGRMHMATLHYHPPGVVRVGWRNHLPSGRQESPDTVAAAGLLRALILKLEERKSFNDDYGLIHSDLHYWNFAVGESGIVVFDHDNCEYHWLAADLGTALFEASTCAYQNLDRNEVVRYFLNEFLAGYRTQRDPAGLLEHLHDFVKLRELQIFLILSER